MTIIELRVNMFLPEWDAKCSPLQAAANAECCPIAQHCPVVINKTVKMVKTNYFQRIRLITSSTDLYYSLDSEDDFSS